MMEKTTKVELSFPEFKVLVRLLTAEMVTCLPTSVPLFVDDLLMDRVGVVADDVWFAITMGEFTYE